jgi:hypothetical protein
LSYIYIVKHLKTKQTVMTSNRPSNYAKLSYTQKVSRINRKLRTGDITRVADTTGFSTTHVSDVISGKYFNERIVNEAYDVTRGRVSNAVKLNSF